MTTAVFVIFGGSFVGIIALFLIKQYEVSRGHLVGGMYRERADEFALQVKWVFLVIEWYLARLPLFFSILARWSVRQGALAFARLARTLEAYAHQLADLASHKRNFSRRETKSDFLKQVGEAKNGKDSVETRN